MTLDRRLAADAVDSPGIPASFRHVEGNPATAIAARLLAATVGTTTTPLLRIGADACDIAVLRRQMTAPTAAHFLTTRFTADELAYCAGRADRVAARWTAKEAVAKAVGSGFRGLSPAQIEITRHPDGAPYVSAADERPWPYNAHNWQWSVSLAHEGELAIAVAIAVVMNGNPERLIQEEINIGRKEDCR